MKRATLFPLILAIFLVSFICLSGCSKRPTQVDNFYGTSYRLAMESQLYNPIAGTDIKPIEEITGTIGEKVINRYEGEFEKSAPKTDSYSVSFGGMEKSK